MEQESYTHIYVWNVESKSEVAELGEHKDRILALCWSADGQRLLSCTSDLAYGVTTIENKEMKQTRNAHD